jgi:beta-glucosidase
MPVIIFGVLWVSDLVPPVTGTYYLGTWGSSGYDILFEGDTLLSFFHDHHAAVRGVPVELTAGKRYRIEVFYRNHIGDADMELLWCPPRGDMVQEAVEAASAADAVIVALGLSPRLEGEEMSVKLEGFEGGDRTSLSLPAIQEELLDALLATGKPVVVVLMTGSPVASPRAQEQADAVLLAGYPGVEGGNAIADVIFGDYNPGGRLPVTWYRSVDQLPPFEEYDMTNRTYRYFTGTPLYPFGYGLSYTTFEYSDLELPERAVTGSEVRIKVTVTNTGALTGDEVVQLYLTDEKASSPRPLRQMEGFTRITLNPGENRRVEFTLKPGQFSIINNKDKRVIEPGWFTVAVGGRQPGTEAMEQDSTGVLTKRLRLTGREIAVSE